MGCLTAPFKMLGCLLLIAALALGWFFRDRLTAEARRRLGVRAPVAPGSVGRPGVRALESARSKIDSLNGWRADSVVLTPAELASLIGAGLSPQLRGRLDSLQVFPRDGELALRAKLKTGGLPKELVGPLAFALEPTEPVEAAGPVEVVRPRRAEWALRRFWIREFPIPKRLVPKLVGHAFGDSTRRTVPVRIPAGIRRIRLGPAGATLYGAPRP
jgi:hypothetical protein